MTFSNSTLKSAAQAIGLHRLIKDFGLDVVLPSVRSEVVRGARKTRIADGSVLEQYPLSYAPKDVFGHLRFAMRYEPIDLNVLSALFAKIHRKELEAWIKGEPIGRYPRRAWYLYELLTGVTLDVPEVPPTDNVLLLDPALHITATGMRVRRQRIIDNLLGNRDYCPMIRRTDRLNVAMQQRLAEEAKSILEGVDPALLARAVHYLFTKETKSSFAIEGEVPSTDRTLRFVAALGRAHHFDTGDKQAFVELQNSIVDPRYTQKDWRAIQNYVGQTASNYTQIVHFICPKPEDVASLMDGWMRTVARVEDGAVDPICAATITGFGFVFIHPFEDGNGRIHRFLIHHSLAKLKFAPQGLLFPVSAAMLRDPKAYDTALNAFSGKIMPKVEYDVDEQQRLTVLNKTDRLYRYYDATAQAEYLYEAVAETIRKDLREEIEFLEVFDKAMSAAQKIVDMPNARASLLVRLILQNHGTLSGKKRRQFAELSDEEVTKIEEAIRATNVAAEVNEELEGSNFEQFLQEREAKQNDFKTAEEVVAQGTADEWQRLIGLTRTLTAGKAVDGNPFAWTPYQDSDQDFLQLKDVAASFSQQGKRNGLSPIRRVRFHRHASTAAQGVVVMEDKSPIPSELWSLEPRANGQNVVWWVSELAKSFTSAELASQIAIRLVKQYETYEQAFGR
ncbi:MAG: Fic family protein [Acidobacteriota bacterium]|nr:Fic family protein [Acidobacteriota bacterium]